MTSKLYKYFFIIIFLFAGMDYGFADRFGTISPGPEKLCGSSAVTKDFIQSEFKKFKKNRPELYKKWVSETRSIATATENERTFWAYKFESGLPISQRFYQVPATLKRSMNNTNIWIENSSLQNNYVNEPILDSLINALEIQTSSQSLFPDKGIYEIDTMLFGQPPNYDGDHILDFLVLNIIDDFDSLANPSFIAGYFSSFDQTADPASNQRDIMYIDSYPGIFYQDSYRTRTVLSTTAHELQHLIHFNYDENEENWLNEGLSELAATYCGYGLSFPDLYLNDTNVGLTEWSGEVKDYARVNLWTLYCSEQLGLNYVKQLTQSADNGITAINNIVPPGKTFEDYFFNWNLANLINDVNFNTEYGYQHYLAKALRAKPGKVISEFYGTGNSVKGIIRENAAEYHRFRGRDSLDINFLNAPGKIYWYQKSRNGTLLQELNVNRFNLPDFSELDQNYLIFSNSGPESPYEYDADAIYSYQVEDLGFGGDRADFNISISEIAANRITLPGNDYRLETIRFWNGTANATVRIHAFKFQNGIPGEALIPPIDTTFILSNQWVSVPVSQNHQPLQTGQQLLLGIEMKNADQSIGYESSNQPGNSYVYQNNQWTPLQNFTLSNNEKATGVWLIRADFSRLILSDSLNIINVSRELQVNGNYPNPYRLKNGKVKIDFEIPEVGEISLVVFNNLGQKIAEEQKTFINAGLNTFEWYPLNMNNVPPSSGVYFIQLVYKSPFSAKSIKSDFIKQVILH